MRGRIWGLAILGVGTLAGIHGCSSDDAPGAPPRAGKGGAGHGGAPAGGKAGSVSAGGRAGGGAGKNGKGGAASGDAGQAGQSASGGGAGGQAGAENGGASPEPHPESGAGGAAGESGGGAGGVGEGGAACDDSAALGVIDAAPASLDLTGLYTSASAAPDDVAPYVREFTPRYPLWSDGATKRRWIYLPPCTQIDTSDMDHWQFPVGTRFWKEFTVAGGSGDGRVETRFIHRYGPGANDWLFAAYQWDQVGSPTAGNTTYVPGGVANANGTTHDIPSQSDCTNCHGKLPEHILGFGAIELSAPSSGGVGVSLQSLGSEGLLTVSAPNGFDPPGDATAQAGLGYLHANCGICHNAYFTPTSPPAPRMRLLVGQTTVTGTDTYTTLANVPTQNPQFAGHDRIEPGDHTTSTVIERMLTRGTGQMPPIASEIPDPTGVDAVSAFIDGL
jgi:hypothetical protein